MGEDENDALAYSPAGFIWDNAVKHGISIWNFGEFAMPTCGWTDPKRKGPAWKDYYAEFLHGKGEVLTPAQRRELRPFTPTNYVGWEMSVPDVWRARHITNQIAQWGRDGRMPQMVIICLPNDHTSGTSRGAPTPGALVADNDLAFGQIVQALSHTRFWKEMAIFGIEDDPQAGWDHVSGTDHGLRHQSLGEAQGGDQHAVQHHQPPAHHGTDPGPAADEPVRRRGHAHDGLLRRHAGLRPVRGVAEPGAARRNESEPKGHRGVRSCARPRLGAA